MSDCAFAPNSGGGDCFFICLEQATGHSAYSQRVLLSSAMTAEDLEVYQAIRTQCAAELSSAISDQANGVPISEIRIERDRIVIEEMEFCRNATDVISLRMDALKRNYWTDPIEIEILQLSLSAKVIVLRSQGGREYEIAHDVLPDGVANFAPDAFVVARYGGSHYELSVDSGGKKSPQYAELPGHIRARLVGQGSTPPFRASQRCGLLDPSRQPEPKIITAQPREIPRPRGRPAYGRAQ